MHLHSSAMLRFSKQDPEKEEKAGSLPSTETAVCWEKLKQNYGDGGTYVHFHDRDPPRGTSFISQRWGLNRGIMKTHSRLEFLDLASRGTC